MHIWHRGEEYLLCFRGRVLFKIPRLIDNYGVSAYGICVSPKRRGRDQDI